MEVCARVGVGPGDWGRVWTRDWGHPNEEVEANRLVVAPLPNGRRSDDHDHLFRRRRTEAEKIASMPTIPSAPGMIPSARG